MTTTNKVSQVVSKQLPQFVEDNHPLLNKLLEYYYKSQEKTGYGQNILNDFLQYLNIDKLNIDILDGATKLVQDAAADATTITVENVDSFLDKNGSILINDEVIFYEKAVPSPSVALSPGISYDQVKVKWIGLSNPINDFDGVKNSFPLLSQNSPVSPPSPQHLIVKLYNKVLIGGVDYTLDNNNINFTTPPRAKTVSDGFESTNITYLKGFSEDSILALDDISNNFGDNRTSFNVTRGGVPYRAVVDEYIIAIYDGNLLTPKTDFTFDETTISFNFIPLVGRKLALFSIEAPIPSFGSGAVGFSRVNEAGAVTGIEISKTGSDYRFEYAPKVSIKSKEGSNAAVRSLINGIKNTQLLGGGKGYSESNPPTVNIQSPTKAGGTPAKLSAKVVEGSVSEIVVEDSGSGYTFIPRVTFAQPGGATLGTPTMVGGSFSGEVPVTSGGSGYTTAPVVYVDEPTGEDPIIATFQAVLNDRGEVESITTLNAGQGYTSTPRIAVIDPVGAQILETKVDADGRLVDIEILSGGSGYDDVPSVYIVDDRLNDVGASIGGSGATAVAAIFNGQITDINITEFGYGYSQSSPPKIIIQSPPSATASVEIGTGEVTGFEIINGGSGYEKCRFEGCARAASGITSYTNSGDVVFSGETVASTHSTNDAVTCLDAVFVKRLLDKYTEQYLPDVPKLDYASIDVRNAIKNIKTFYSTKGTSFSVAYLFKLLYGEDVSISYPKDQIIKPSSATWSINTILRATLETGDPVNIKDALVQQFEDIADENVKDASALVENYIAIKTSDLEIYELVLSEETIEGTFIVPYKTKLGEGLTETTDVITVDSTIGWPERNGEIVIANDEIIRYKEKSLNQFIECTRASSGTIAKPWDAASEVKSNFKIYLNKDTPQEVVMNIVGIVDAQQTTLSDTGSYYLPGDKLTVSKLGGTTQAPQLTGWLYNVKKLIEVTGITYGGVNNQSATVTCSNDHGLLVGDQVTIYGANPTIYNGTFLVSSRDSANVFQYVLPNTAVVEPQGNILISVDLNKGKSTDVAIESIISLYTTNVQNTFFNNEYVYVASTGIPNYNIGPFVGSALLPGNQRKLNRFPLTTQTISTKTLTQSGSIGTWINGVSVQSYKSTVKKTFGAVTSIDITDPGSNYDAERPPTITIAGGGGSDAAAAVVVDGSLTEIEVLTGGSDYTTSPLVSIVGGGGSGASATAIVTRGSVSRILVNNGGTGYTSKPSITIVGGGGTGATGNASVRGPVKSINITNGGSSYTSAPTVTLSSGEGAVAQPIVSNGRIISIAIISGGVGYTTAPEVTILGDGFGAVAKATIDLDGENVGKVTSIQILNRGIGYTQGLTTIVLDSVGSGGKFAPNVFKWVYNLQATTNTDSAKGAIFEGLNTQYGGEYAHISNPQRLRYILGDNLISATDGSITEKESQLEHSPIIGWAYDGNPIYGPYSYEDPTDLGSNIVRMRSSYALKTNLVFDEISNPTPVRIDGPLLTSEIAGNFVEDYEYNFGSGDLDQYNGRFCKTPDFPDGRYCYFVTIDATAAGNPIFPYVIGDRYNSLVDSWNLSTDAIQQNIPSGVIRYRDPYENVDIDVERTPNETSNAITTEDGFILLFDPEDEDRSGVIEQAEIDDPEQMYEESPLQLYDYFPKVRFDSKVDIEVETIEKFEDASVSGFIIENPGKNYQVNDILVFDNTDTDGSGISARISKITGEQVQSYTFESVEGISYGILTTVLPHNIITGDEIFVDYTPIMDNTNKTYKARQYKGIEEITVTQTGSGYNVDIPPEIVIDGDGEDAEIEAVLTTVGSIDTFNIVNSGSGYVNNPRIISSHPQVFKKADYYATLINNNDYVKINDIHVSDSKETFLCGSTLDAQGDTVGFIAKISALGVKEWERTLESSLPAAGTTTLEFERLLVDGLNVWVVGHNRPNGSLLEAYNPDIVLTKYTQAEDGLSAILTWQKTYSGISGSTRADNVTSLVKLSDSRFVLGGYTNTNSSNPYDAFIAVVDTAGTFVNKRKLSSADKSEKIVDMIVNGDNLYYVMELADVAAGNDITLGLGKASVSTTLITIDWVKEIEQAVYSLIDASLVVDEYNELYITSTLRLKSDDITRDSIWVGKFAIDSDLIWSYRYLMPSREVSVVNRSAIDIFGNLNIAYTEENITSGENKVGTIKINYKGEIVNHTQNTFDITNTTDNNIEGLTAGALEVDNSGDVYVFGQTKWNRNECVFDFAASETVDLCGRYTLNTVGLTSSVTYEDNVAKIYGYNPSGLNSSWVNSAIRIDASDLGDVLADNWTLDFMIYKDATASQTLSQADQTICGIGTAQEGTGGLWLGYNIASGELQLVTANNATQLQNGSGVSSSQTNMYADNSWQHIALSKEGNSVKVYVNTVLVINASITNTAWGNKNLYFGNQEGFGATATDYNSAYQGQFFIDNIRIRNRPLVPTAPSDFASLPPATILAFAHTWVDTAWFTNNITKYDYIDYKGFGLKVDKNADAARLGDQGIQTNSQVKFTRTAIVPVLGTNATVSNVTYALGDSGLQNLDYNEADSNHTDALGSITYSTDVWSSRNATIPAPGSQKVQVTAKVKNRYYFNQVDTIKIDNIQKLTINQEFQVTIGAKLNLNNGASFVNSGYITGVDKLNKHIYVAVNNNDWSNDLNIGELTTIRFDEQDTYGVIGPNVNDINEIKQYQFLAVTDTTPGTFDVNLANYDAPSDIGGTNNLNLFGKFKPWGTEVYKARILETSGTSPYIPGSVIEIPSSSLSWNAEYSTVQITGLTAVVKIDLIADLTKILQVTAVSNSDEVYVITNNSHYLNTGDVIYVDGNPTTQVGATVYDEYNGSFTVHSVIGIKEFTYKLGAVAVAGPATIPGNVEIFAKSPILKQYYGHQYIFDVSHSTMLGGNISFSKDSLNKLEYSFNSIERIGTPGVTGQGLPTPSVKLKVDEGIVTNISYYFDPSRTGEESPVDPNSFLDIVPSPYIGTFVLTSTSGGTITTGDNTCRFKLGSEPEGSAETVNTTYQTSSIKAVGSIGDVRIVNPGGFYTKLPAVTSIISSRKIERVQINEPGTEYEPGDYISVPIAGDGEGGYVSIKVENTTDDEGETTPGQIVEVNVTSPGKGYTTANIDIQSIPGILGSGLSGSGADLEVVIPPYGTGASIFTKGTNVGKIKKLNNNNFGYDYTHDYTLRPEITFPLNAQLINTSILESITITNPGSGYTQAPVVTITGGGGSGAIAESTVKNGRLDSIIVKDPGAGYSTEPVISLKSSFNYVVNLDLGLLQFAYPHGITNGAEIQLNVVDTGDGADFPVAAGAIGTLNGSTTYYAITGAANSLDTDQMKIALTESNAELGDAMQFINPGVGRQQVLTSSFGGAAEANVITSTFLEGELLYQGDTLENATATGYVSTNSGWQIGSRIVKIVNYDGLFNNGQKVTGTISKSSGVISDIKIAKGVLEIGPITKTTGQFVDDVGKPSEIIQKIQDSYYYQDFSYAVNSSVSIEEWKNTVIKNVHPASFKVFGQLEIQDKAEITNKETDFELTKSVELARDAVVPNIQSFALGEPIYQEFNNTEVLFRQKRLTSSENILTSVVQRVDNISGLFDGERTQFPLTIEGENVIANSNQLMIILNGVVQTPEESFKVLNDSIVFNEPPNSVAAVKYVDVTVQQISTKVFTVTNASGIFPNVGDTLKGVISSAEATVVGTAGNTVTIFVTQGTFQLNEIIEGSATAFSALLITIVDEVNTGLFRFGETIRNIDGDTAKVERINLATGQETPIADVRFSIGISTVQFDVIQIRTDGVEAALPDGTFTVGSQYQIASEIVTIQTITNGAQSTTLEVLRGQSGTTATAHLAGTPIYGTEVEVTNSLLLSKTLGTYQSTPGLFDIQLNDIIIAAGSKVVARITSTTPYQDPVTSEFVDTVTISEGSTFFGLLFNRITSQTYPNVILDNLSQSQINIVEYDNFEAANPFNDKFPANEIINNYIIKYISPAGAAGAHTYVGGTSVAALTFNDDSTKNVTDATYNGATGELELTIGNHSYTTSNTVKIGEGKLSFTCDLDDNATTHAYPRLTDPCYNTLIAIGSVTATTITVNVGIAGGFSEGETIRNYKLDYSNNDGEFLNNDTAYVRKLSLRDEQGDGFFSKGQIIRSENSKAEVLGFNRARSTVYLGKMGRSKPSGEDFHHVVFHDDAQLDTSQKKYGNSSLLLGKAFTTHIWVSGVDDAITADAGGPFTAASGTTYNPVTGDLVLEIGSHSLTTSNTIQIATGGLSFTCDGDNHTSAKTYPRATDPVAGQTLAITAVSATTITVDVGVASTDLDYINIDSSTEFGFGTGDFTIDGWFRPDNLTGAKAIIDFRTTGTEVSPYLYLDGGNVKYFVNGSVVITGTASIASDTWFHFAISRSSGVTKMFINGSQDGSDYADTNNYGTTKPIRIGATIVPGDGFIGSIDEVRISSVARYTTNFTAPLGFHQGDLDTKLLLHFDGTDGEKWTDDWSGEQDWTNGHDFNNDAILATSRKISEHIYVGGTATNAVLINQGNVLKNVTDAWYNSRTGDLELEIGSHSYTTSNTIQIAAISLTFTCEQDNHATEHSYPRPSDPVFGKKIAITSVTSTTLTVNVGVALPKGFVGNTHRYLDAADLLLANKEFLSEEIEALVQPSLPEALDNTTYKLINAPDYTSYDYFSWGIGVGNGKIVIGNRGDDSNQALDIGSIYIHDIDGTFETKVVASDASAFDRFGDAVAVGSNKIVVGAPQADPNGLSSGAVYVYDLDGTNEVKITPTGGAAGRNFGYAVAVGDDKIVVGAYGSDSANDLAGAIFVYNLDGTGELKIEPSDGAENDYFGWSIAMDTTNDKIIVGAPQQDPQAESSGAVYIYNYDGSGETKVFPSDGQLADLFGWSVAVGDNNVFYVGAPGDDDRGTSAGAMYVYTIAGVAISKLIPVSVGSYDYYGAKVAGLGTKVFVSAYGADDNAPEGGCIYMFNQDATGPIEKLYDVSTNTNSNLGNTALVAGEGRVLASSRDVVGSAIYAGRAYMWSYASVAGDNAYDTEVSNCIDALASDLRNGSNNHMWDFAAANVDRSGPPTAQDPVTTTRFTGEESFLLTTYGHISRLAQEVVTNQLVNVSGTHGLTQTTDASLTNSLSTTFHTPTGATYDPSTGIVTLTLNDHGFTAGTKVMMHDNALKMSCAFGGASGPDAEKTYPRSTDPISGKFIEISNIQTNTFDIQVLDTLNGSVPSTNTDAHTFVSFEPRGLERQLSTYTTLSKITPKAAAYDAATGNLTINIGTHTLTTSDTVSLKAESFVFTCNKDDNTLETAYPRATDPAANAVLAVTAVGTKTITVNVGQSPIDERYAHTFVSAAKNAVTVLNYTTADCLDVKSTIDSLMSIAQDTLSEGISATQIANGDWLAYVSKITPAYEYLGATVDAFIEVPIDLSLHVSDIDTIYTNRIDLKTKDRFKDAANLIRLNRGAIVDKASFDLLDRYPDLIIDMPRNDDGAGGGTLRCKTDLGQILDGIAEDLEDGGNRNTIRSGRFYLGNNDVLLHIRLQAWQSAYAHERLAHYTKQAITGDLDDTNTDDVIISDWNITNDTPGAQFNVSAATYDVASGDLTMNIGTHQLPAGRMIQLATDSLSFSCTYGSGNHTYVGGIVKYANTGTHTFVTGAEGAITANAGGPFTAAGGTNYDPTTGKMEIFIGNHSLTTANTIQIANDGLTFTCDKDGNATEHTYPRATDPASGKTLVITAVTAASITVNVGIANALMVTGADTVHTYNGGTSSNAITVTGGSQFDVTDAVYDPLSGQLDMTIGSHSLPAPTTHTAESGSAYNPTTGVMTLKVSGHNFANGDLVYLDDGAVTFSCTYGAGNHNYTGGTAVGAVTADNTSVFNVTDADYNATTGVMVLTIGAHSLTTSNTVTITAGSLDFQCDLDNYGSTHSYPRTTDPIYNVPTAITAVGATTITVNVGVSSPGTAYPRANDPISNKWIAISNVTTDTFDIQVLDVTPSTNTDTHTFVSGAAGAIKRAATTVTIGQDKLSFTCGMDGNTATKTYPRATDPVFNTAIAVSAVTATGITVNVGQSSGFVISDVDYNPTTGDMEMTIGNHALTTSNTVTIAPDVLAFTCDADNHQTVHTYPRTTDPSYNTAIAITGVTGTTITVNVGPASGGQTKTYPRATGADYAYQRNLKILSSTTDTITVNVTDGKPTSIDSPHTFVSATANCVTVPGDCANVKDAIDTLISSLNDIISPKDNDYQIAADRLYFNRDYITQEIIGLTKNDYTYSLGGVTYNSWDYSGDNTEVEVRKDFENILLSLISDLQTGGNNSSIDSCGEFIAANLTVVGIQDILGQFIDQLKHLKFVGTKAIQNLLYSFGSNVSGQQYAAQYNTLNAYRDLESPVAIANVVTDFEQLIDILIKEFNPSGTRGLSSAKNMLFNENYYTEEIGSVVNQQFGSASWSYDSFIDTLVSDLEHDIITTDVSSANTTQATKISLLREGVINEINFTGGAEYQSTPTITIDAPNQAGGIQATAEAVLSTNALLTSIGVTGAGSGYSYVPTFSFSGAPFIGTHGGTMPINFGTGQVTAAIYDGKIKDFKVANASQFALGIGCALVPNGTGSGGTGGFNVGQDHVRFGAGTGSVGNRYVSILEQYDCTNVDKIRFYLVAGNAVNGGDANEDGDDLALYWSSNGVSWNYVNRIVYGGTNGTNGINGQNQNWSQFVNGGSVDIPLTEGMQINGVYFRIYQVGHSTDSNFDHYGIWRMGLIDEQQPGFDQVGNTITVNYQDADAQTAATTDPTLQFNASVTVESVNITNRGTGYSPSSPPSATFSGGNPATPAAVTNITVILDSRRFTAGQSIISSAGGQAVVLEDIGNALYVGPTSGIAFAAGQTLFQGAITAVIPSNGVGNPFDWYTNVGNAQTFQTARTIQSLVEGEESSINLVPNPETAVLNSWYNSYATLYNVAGTAPDGSETAVMLDPTTDNNYHYLSRFLPLTEYETFDSAATKFDTETLTWDDGPVDDDSSQQYTVSVFAKANGANKIRLYLRLVPYGSYSLIQVNLSTGEIEGSFLNNTGPNVLTLDDFGAIPYGNGWYRCYITGTFGYGFTFINKGIFVMTTGGQVVFTGSAGIDDSILLWGSKFNRGGLDAYTAVSGEVFYSNIEYNIKKYALELLEDYTELAIAGTLPSPATVSNITRYFDSTIGSDYNVDSIQRIVRENLKMIRSQLLDSDHYLTVDVNSGIKLPTKKFGSRTIPIPLGGGIEGADFLYGGISNSSAEVKTVTTNEGLVVQDYKRFRVYTTITDGPFQMNETIKKQGDPTCRGIVYGYHEDENYQYLDIKVTGGTFALLDTVVGDQNNTTFQIGNIENRIQIIDVQGDFEANSVFRGYSSESTAATEIFLKNDAAVLTNTGGKLVVDTETLNGAFEKTSVVYAENSRLYVEVKKYAGLDIDVGDRVVADGYLKLGVSVLGGEDGWQVGDYLWKMTGGVRDINNYGIINKIDGTDIYVVPVAGDFVIGNVVETYNSADIRVGQGQVSTRIAYSGAAAAVVQSIEDVGLNKRLYLSDVLGTWADTDSLRSVDGYKSAIIVKQTLKARVNRSFRGFDGAQTIFDLTINNGDQYFPDTEGHMLIFINGILQPPGATNAYTAFSDKIQFTEPPSLGSSFTGFYVGKLRQLDDISFEFDSLRQSFNLKRNDVFYSLTLTEGVQSSTIRPENNIIVSLNGVVQEPGVGFELVGSRIIFTEIPRVGSTFVAFSFVGSEADVDAAEVVPPIEPTDFIRIGGEISDREVAVIESSNSLVTFDYLGAVFGKDARASTAITKGSIRDVSVTSPGSGYTSRPVVRVDSISGFDANIKALVGVGGIVVNNGGTGYQNPEIAVETSVPDDWTAPDLSQYGEEVIDPEIV
jgi:hypothetical protein